MKISKNKYYIILKLFFQLGILILFIGSFVKLFIAIPSNIFLRMIFSLLYFWFTVGININLIMPLIKAIDRKTN